MDDEGEVFETVTEDEYKQIVEQRRKANEFVVDDEGLGYYDDGEEHLFNDDGSSTNGRLVNGPKKARGALSSEAIERARRLDEQKKGPRKKVSSMFLGSHSGAVVGPRTVVSAADEAAVGADDFLDSALRNLNDEDDSCLLYTSDAADE